MRRNPYVIVLLVIGLFALVVAFMLTIVLWQVTDSTTHDVVAASALSAWTYVLIGIGVASLVGVLVIAGVAWTMRKAGLDV